MLYVPIKLTPSVAVLLAQVNAAYLAWVIRALRAHHLDEDGRVGQVGSTTNVSDSTVHQHTTDLASLSLNPPCKQRQKHVVTKNITAGLVDKTRRARVRSVGPSSTRHTRDALRSYDDFGDCGDRQLIDLDPHWHLNFSFDESRPRRMSGRSSAFCVGAR